MATLKELADLVGGTVSGDDKVIVERVAPIDVAGAGDITFVVSAKYLDKLQGSQASAVIVTPGVDTADMPAIVCSNPYLAFA